MHEANSFITLTYCAEELPPGGSLVYRDFQLFMKRLRKQVGSRLRYFMCGEYGVQCENCGRSQIDCRCGKWVETFGRPHFHACLFGHDFPDKVLHKRGKGGNLYRSPALEEVWTQGFSTVGALTFESAAYVARYCMAKVNGDAGLEHYRVLDKETGELSQRFPEFGHMSLKPGIGRAWLEKFYSDVYPHGKVVANGFESNPPRYYDKVYRSRDVDSGADLDMRRELAARATFADRSDARLAVREAVTRARVQHLKRELH